jgi:hypothetical protein
MKQISYITKVMATDIKGNPIPDGTGKQGEFDQLNFMLELTLHSPFFGKRQGIEAIEFQVRTRDELRSQESAAQERGYWLVEDARADGLKAANAGANHPTAIMHNWYAFSVAIRDMKDVP